MKNEIWRTITENPKYQVSNLNGWRKMGNGKNQPKGRINNNGYRMVNIGHLKEIAFHILIAKAFPEICGEWFEGASVHHINHNKLDNRPENLVVLTSAEHSKLHYETNESFKKPSKKRNKNISKSLTGRRNTCTHVAILQLDKNKNIINEWGCISDVIQLGFDPSNVSKCCRKKLKTAYGYIWKYKGTE